MGKQNWMMRRWTSSRGSNLGRNRGQNEASLLISVQSYLLRCPRWALARTRFFASFLTIEEAFACSLMIRATHDAKSRFTWCCHILTTRHPMRLSLAKFRRSLARLFRILSRQYCGKLPSHKGNLYPCQKSPSTKTINLAVGKTISGVPGRPETCFLNLRP